MSLQYYILSSTTKHCRSPLSIKVRTTELFGLGIVLEKYVLSIMYGLFYVTNYVDITKEKQILMQNSLKMFTKLSVKNCKNI